MPIQPTKPRRFRSAYEFFKVCAGFSYNPSKGETSEEGKRRCARALEDAEERGTALGWDAEWIEDPDPDVSWMDAPDYDADDKRCAEFYICRVHNGRGKILETLGGIHEDIRDPIGARYYRRVVRAELFAQALAKMAD